MEKSIESIWKEGFLHKDALVAPRINDLYNQKSMHIIDKILGMYRINLIAIMVFAAVLLLIGIAGGVWYMGLIMFLLFCWLVFFSKNQIEKVKQIDKGQSSYIYLKAFDQWHEDSMKVYSRVYRFFYPLMLFSCLLGMWFSNIAAPVRDIVLNDADNLLISGVPILWLLGALAFSALFGFFAPRLYRWDVRLVYGPVFDKVKELISDMEELRK